MFKIVHFGKYYYPDIGGIESVVNCLATETAKTDFKVSVICFNKYAKNVNEVIDNVEIYRFKSKLVIASQPISIKYILCCIRIGRTADIIHLHHPNILGFLSALTLRKKNQLLIHWHSDIINKGILGTLIKPIEYLILRKAKKIIATSYQYLESSSSLTKFKKKVVVVPIGVKDIRTNSINKSFNSNIDYLLNKTQGKHIILSVGRLVPYKGFDVLINSVKYLNDDAVIVIIGSGQLKITLDSLVEKNAYKDRVFIVGQLSDNELQILFKKADIYCLSSVERSEAFGVVLLEAMSYSLPIVATNIKGSGVSWVNKHNISGLNVPVKDPRALANAINKILNDENLKTRLSLGSRSRYESKFTENITINKVIAIYNKILTI